MTGRRRFCESQVNYLCPATSLKGIIVCDEASTSELKVGTYRYFREIEKMNL